MKSLPEHRRKPPPDPASAQAFTTTIGAGEEEVSPSRHLRTSTHLVAALCFRLLRAQFNPRWGSSVAHAINWGCQKQSSTGCFSNMSMESSLRYRNPLKRNDWRRRRGQNTQSENANKLALVWFESNLNCLFRSLRRSPASRSGSRLHHEDFYAAQGMFGDFPNIYEAVSIPCPYQCHMTFNP